MNQHFVPKFLIEGFVNDSEPGNRGVWVYRASERRWSKRPTKKTAALEDFYTFADDTSPRDDTLEEFMGRIEKQFAQILQNVIKTRRPLTPPQPFDIIVTFCALLICRNPDTVTRTGETLVREAKQVIAEAIATEESFQAFRAELHERAGIDFPNIVPEHRARLLTDFSVDATKAGSVGFAGLMLQVLPESLGHMAVTFYHTSSSRPFITSDLPYAVIWSQENVGQIEQLVVPLSSCVTAVFDAGQMPTYRHLDASPAIVRQVNGAILSVAGDFLISRDPEVIPVQILERWSRASQHDRAIIAQELGA
jgi:hypothetical protein